MKRALIAASIIMTATVAANATETGTLSGDALRKAVIGKTVYLRTQGIELPISYRSNGTMSGRLKAFVAALAGGASPTDSGKWWITKDQLCQRWSQWLDGKSYCYKLQRKGALVQWRRNDGRSGTLRIGG